jgi:hypothetical protein
MLLILLISPLLLLLLLLLLPYMQQHDHIAEGRDAACVD